MFKTQTKLYTPKFLIYSHCKVKINVNDTNYLNCINTSQKVPSVMLVDEYKKILLKSPNKEYVRYLDNSSVKIHDSMISDALTYIKKKYNNKYTDIIKKDILLHSYYTDESLENWNATNLARKYMLSGFDFFSEMATKIDKINSDERKQKLINDFENKFTSNSGFEKSTRYAFFDYYDNSIFRMKNSFPKDINNDKTPLILNMRRYDESCYNCAYIKVFNLIAKSIENNTINNNFISYEDKEPIHETNNIDIINKVVDHNKLVMDSLSLEEKKLIEEKNQNCYNHRNNYFNYRNENEKIWEYQTLEFYNSYIKKDIIETNKNYKLELLYAFDYDYNNIIKFSYSTKIEDVSVINMLIYGKTMLKSSEDLERLLSYVRFKQIYNKNSDIEIYQLDNYVIEYKGLYYNDNKKYTIKWNQDNIDDLTFVQKDIEKLYAAEYLIQLMNEVDPNLLNFHNYILVSKWYFLNNSPIEIAHNVTKNHYKNKCA